MQQILLVTDEGREEEVVTRLSRVGYDHAIGYLKGGISAWIKSGRDTDEIISVTPEELAVQMNNAAKVNILDVRKTSEYVSEHLLDAKNMPLDYINNTMAELDKDSVYYVHCAGGYRSMIFNSILRARGFDHLIDVKGGFKAIKESGKFEISAYICPSTITSTINSNEA